MGRKVCCALQSTCSFVDLEPVMGHAMGSLEQEVYFTQQHLVTMVLGSAMFQSKVRGCNSY